MIIGGGTGTYTVLSALRNYDVNLSAIVSMCDDGGSTGRLRDEYGTLPAGDIRRSLVALSSADFQLRELFEFRFNRGDFAGHNFGNLFLTALEQLTGDFYKAVKMASKILNVQGSVLPVTLENVRLYAELENGATISGETNIDIPKHNPELEIKRIFIKPRAKANPDVIKAISGADAIIIGPGDIYTSILPNFLVSGIAPAIKKSKGKKIYVCNIMTKYGETNGLSAKEFIGTIEKYAGKKVLDFVLANVQKPDQSRLKEYAEEKAELVTIPANFGRKGLIRGNFITNKKFIRHDPDKLGKAIMKLCH